jgi:hypothetical protein
MILRMFVIAGFMPGLSEGGFKAPHALNSRTLDGFPVWRKVQPVGRFSVVIGHICDSAQVKGRSTVVATPPAGAGDVAPALLGGIAVLGQEFRKPELSHL